MRFLCISDVHGHLSALRAVLATAERRGYQKLLVAGDLCFPGPEALETWRTLQREQAVCVQGVTDKALAAIEPSRVEELASDPAQKAMAKTFLEVQRGLGELVVERLRRLPTHHRIALEDGRELLLVHGSPEDPTEPMSHDLDDDELLALMGDDPADVVVCGMSHTPFVREIGEVTIINVGSVGEAPGGGVAYATFIETSPQGIIIDPISVPLDDA